MLHQFGWFPVTVERPKRSETYILHGARYDDVNREVAVDDDYQARFFGVDQVAAFNDQEFRFTNEYGEPIVIRPTRPADAASWDRVNSRIDLPVEIIGAIMTFNTTDPSVTAAVDAQGDVHTMVLETSVGLYARYSRSWIKMTDISPIEQLDIVDVPADDLEIYDQADDAGQTVNIRFLHPVDQPALGTVEVTPTVMAASAAPVVASVADLADAAVFAANNPESRWYVERRWRVLGGRSTGVTLPWLHEEES